MWNGKRRWGKRRRERERERRRDGIEEEEGVRCASKKEGKRKVDEG